MPGSTTATIPIIAVTAHTTPDDEEATRNAGCDDFTAKPIDVDQLFEAVDRVLS